MLREFQKQIEDLKRQLEQGGGCAHVSTRAIAQCMQGR